MPSQGDWDCGNSWRSISNGTVQRPSSWCWWVINEPCGPAWECERPHWGPLAHWCLFHPHWLCRLLRLLHTSSKWTQLQYLFFFYGAKYQPALVGHLRNSNPVLLSWYIVLILERLFITCLFQKLNLKILMVKK